MNRKLLPALGLCAGLLLLFSIPVFAHHGGSSLYDMGKSATVKATVTDFVWANPHCEISFDGADETGKARHCDVSGIKVPFRWTVTWLDGRSIYELTELRPNIAIDAAKFAKPVQPQLKPASR